MDSSARSFPTASLWREKAALSPFQRSLCSLPPLLGLRPPTKRAIPLGTPAALLPQISKLTSVEKPCPPAFRRNANIIWASPDYSGEVGGVNNFSLKSPRRFGSRSSPTPFALGNERGFCALRCGGLSKQLPSPRFLFVRYDIMQLQSGRVQTPGSARRWS